MINNLGNLVIVEDDEWEGIYVNGKIYAQGEYISHLTILNAAKVAYNHLDTDGILEAGDKFPNKLDDLLAMLSARIEQQKAGLIA